MTTAHRPIPSALLAALLAAVFSVVTTIAATTTRPNILVIISDDQGWEDFSFIGHPHIATPALDQLAAQSLTFTRGYSPVPLCRPSLTTIATGLYPHQHGVTGNDPALPDTGVNPQTGRQNPKYARYYDTIIENFRSRPNFIRELTARGYRSFETGKWWEGDPVKSAGFSEAMTVGTAKGDRHGGHGLEIGRQGLAPITDFIGRSGAQPWLVWYAPMLPHAPHTPPADLLQKYLKLAPSEPVARYWASVEWFDRTCGELLGYLDKNKLRENTIVLFTTDNGWIQDPQQANRFAPRSKLTPYEGGNRTPIMISWPGHLAPRLDREHLASNIDLWPTLAALLQTPIPKNLPGLNLTDSTAVARRTTIHGEQYAHNIADVDAPTRSLEHRWIIDGWMKLIVPDARNHAGKKPELYDLKNDPWEKSDLAAKQPDQVKALNQKLDAWWTPPASANEVPRVIRRHSAFVSIVSALVALSLARAATENIGPRGAELLTLDNGTVKVGIDRAKGAAITWLSWTAYPKNIVNSSDPGRLIQQSYYAGLRLDRRAEGQSKSWSPWSWNPIQGGGVASWARVTEFKRLDASTLYGETIPNLWDMPAEPAAALMRQWTGFEPGLPDVVRVRCEFIAQREPGDRWGPAQLSPQEIPACYFTRNFSTVKSYLGGGAWREETQPPGPPWGRTKPPLNIMACFAPNGQGVAIFSPTATQHWNFGPHGGGASDDPAAGPCMHVAPLDRVNLGPNSTYRYRYWLIVGTETQLPARLDALLEKYSTERAELTNP